MSNKNFIFCLLLGFVSLLGCSSKNRLKETKINRSQRVKNIIDKQKLLNGIWAENEADNAVFYIRGDSLYYVEDLENPYVLKVKSDTLIWRLNDGYIVKEKVLRLTKDSLILYSPAFQDTLKLYKRGKF